MIRWPILTLVFLGGLLGGCAAQQSAPAGPSISSISVSPTGRAKVGRKIWQNECGGTIAGLTSWNKNEAFASLGIGHFIWYPKGSRKTYRESFPGLVKHLRRSGVEVPVWLASASACPWPNRAAFLADKNSRRMRELRELLSKSVQHQTDYIVLRLQTALPKMLQVAPVADRAQVRSRFHALSRSPNGLYALIDYVNFKGEGTNSKERYRGRGWGLLQVLLEMRGTPDASVAPREFSRAAKAVLERRIKLAPKSESQWRRGWFNRCDTYARAF